ncbi:hypothetical protein CN676_05765 [Bacillus wiedmannii]|uniref:hypothetical protein n=1 Tax=Bacillus cereus group TaxID=86661 RepID=UPI000BEDF6B2|nr:MULTISPECIES: hypothetical protein [Bacillus cereus group]MBJ8047032.1 hypothetical protein [Bacillus cereus group sp. N18]PEE01341.1 hypothetical protein CON78_08265 [Bacillus toyonensis]PEJ55034.1 hypothetical protein CN676_05765 [Bacillus wiedmannii]
MARKTKQMLEQEVRNLQFKIEQLKSDIQTLRLEKDYWFVKSERYLLLYTHEERKSWDCYNEHESAYEQMKERELKELEKMEKNFDKVMHGVKAYQMKQEINDLYYGAGW